MGFYTGTPEGSKAKLIRLGYEMQARRTRVWEHPNFGGVNPVHMVGSKHNIGAAFDLNRFYGQSDENINFDRFSLELMARGWGVIWNRQKWAGDHTSHMHVECITKTWENYDGRVKLKYPYNDYRFKLAVDGAWGRNTTLAVQRMLGVGPSGSMDYTTVRALQRVVNTELNLGLIGDGKFGPKTIAGLQRVVGTPATGAMSARGSSFTTEVQRRLNRHGHIFRDA